LHEVKALDAAREDAEFLGGHQIFGIVQDHGLRARAGLRLIAQQRLPQAIEAIGLGGRPGGRPDHQPHAGTGNGLHCGDRRGIIGVAANVEAVIALSPGGERRAEHVADNCGFVPGGDEDGERAPLPRRGQVGDGRLAAAQAGKGESDPDCVHHSVARAEDDKPRRGEQRRLAHDHVEAR
jgi:hypothetical protein